jgi:hypothetical protein
MKRFDGVAGLEVHTSLASLVPTKLTPDAGVTSGTILIIVLSNCVRGVNVPIELTFYNGIQIRNCEYMSTVARTSKYSALVLTEGCAEPTFWRRWCGEIAWGGTAHRAVEWF